MSHSPMLRPVTTDNWQDVVNLQLAPGQERFVASAAETLAESGIYPYYVNRAIYSGDEVVGLVQYHPMAPEGTPGEYFVSQLMVDVAYQRRGMGSKALALVLDELSGKSDCRVISICHVHGHDSMARLFQRFGFEVITQTELDAVVYERQVKTSEAGGIELRPVTRDNFEDVSDLQVFEHQQDYVADTSWSLLEAAYHDNYTCRGVYHGDVLVGFFMWVQASAEKISIWRFLIDKAHQQNGYGKQALQSAIDEISAQPWVKEIEICYQPDNPMARDFYAAFGFVETGMDEDDDDMLAVLEVRACRDAA